MVPERYVVEIVLEKLEIKLKKPRSIAVVFKRGIVSLQCLRITSRSGNRQAETKNTYVVENGCANLEETLALPVHFYRNQDEEKYEGKQVGMILYSDLVLKEQNVLCREF